MPRAESLFRRLLCIGALIVLTGCAPARPPVGALTPARLRTTNEAGAADLQVIEQLAGRVRAARAAGAGAGLEREYAAAAAAEWVAFARDAYRVDPRGPAVDEAFEAAARLLELLENGASSTDLTASEAELGRVARLAVERPRLDLWVDAHALRDDATGWPAAAPLVGEMEVLLVRIAHAASPAPDMGARREPCFVDALADRAARLGSLAKERARASRVAVAPPPPRPVVAPAPIVAAAPIAAKPDVAPVASLEGAVHFALNSAALSPQSQLRLDSVARSLAARGALRLVIEGYTDPRGSRVYNAKLSRRRAEAVAKYLTDAGLDLTSATLRAMGSAVTAKNATREEMAKARRVNLRFFEADGREVDAKRDALDLQVEEERRPQRTARPPAGRRATRPPPSAKPKSSTKKSSTKRAAGGAR